MGEHSAENEIPFAQIALPHAKLIVALMGDHDESTIRAFSESLHKLASTKKIAVVASTDLLHDSDYEKVTRTDKKTLELMSGLKEAELRAEWSYKHQVCCGIGPVCVLLRFAKLQGRKSGVILKYRNSGDDYPESRGEWVVGYGSVIF